MLRTGGTKVPEDPDAGRSPRVAATEPGTARSAALGRAAGLFGRVLARRYWQDRFADRQGAPLVVEDRLGLVETAVGRPGGGLLLAGRWLRAAASRRHRAALFPDRASHVVCEARLVWTLAHLVRSAGSQVDPRDRTVLRARYQRLVERFLDRQEGGFFWRRSRDGGRADDAKLLCGQGFAIYALVEVARALGDGEAATLARATFQRVHEALHDRVHGGWHEVAERTLVPRHSGAAILEPGFRAMPGAKSLNGHLHWLEALSALLRLGDDTDVAVALEEALRVTHERFRPEAGNGCASFRDARWRPVRGFADEVVYGHLLELAWLRVEAERALARAPSWEVFDGLIDEALRCGFDWERGGFYLAGPYGAPASRRDKFWWVQAEGLVALSDCLRRPRQGRRNAAFAALVDWVGDHQLDLHRGVWIWATDELGRPSNFVLAGNWKAGYHEVRAMCRVVAAAREELA